MKIKSLLISASLFAVSSPIALMACAPREHRLELEKHECFVDKNIQDSSSRKHILLSNINRNMLSSLPSSLNGFFHSKMVSGGFAEKRHYYSKTMIQRQSQIHAGIDSMMPSGTKIVSPVDGQLIASLWIRSKKNNIGEGTGGIVIIKTKISDLNIPEKSKEFIYIKNHKNALYKIKHPRYKYKIAKVPKLTYTFKGVYHEPTSDIASKAEYNNYIKTLSLSKRNKQIANEEYIFLTFEHLSRSSVSLYGSTKTITTNKAFKVEINTDIDIKRPKEIHRGQKIGVVGTSIENGGWITHVHTEVNSFGVESLNRFKRFLRYDTSGEHYKRAWRGARPLGTLQVNNDKKSWTQEQWAKYFAWHSGTSSSNNIYNLYDDKTETVHLLNG